MTKRNFEIKKDQDYIKLGQLLKAEGIAESGTDAKILISEGEVKVNGEACLMRGKKVKRGDTVSFRDLLLIVE